MAAPQVCALVLACALLAAHGAVTSEQLFDLSLVHFNDFHARFEQMNPSTTKCIQKKTCIGGFGRLYTAIENLKTLRPDSVVLNAGDSFQGTLWYNVLRWNVTSHFMNMLSLDAHTLGNHEFDHNVAGVTPYLKALTAPMLAANIDDSLEPTIQGLYKKSLVIERNGRKIGIIGVVLSTFFQIANTDKLKFTDEVAAVNREAALLKAQGVNIIIVLSHCGFNVDKKIAQETGDNVDVVVGGHSHSLLYTGPSPSGEVAEGNYPTVVKHSSGNSVLVVTASAFTKYLGNISIKFDASGKIKSWEGKPIYLDFSVKPNADVLKALEPYKEQVDKLGRRNIGNTNVLLNQSACYFGECNIGSFLGDAFVASLVPHADSDHWTYASICLLNPGGIRTNIEKGQITYADLITSQPFGNTLQTVELKGKYLLEALEYSVSVTYSQTEFIPHRILQVSGIRVVYKISNPVGSRVVSALVKCAKCAVPLFSPINPEETYRVAAPNFLIGGGDGFVAISEHKKNQKTWGLDVELLEKYITKQSPIIQGVDGRITLIY